MPSSETATALLESEPVQTDRVAELERILDDARQADRAKSEFLASISHELRTPVSGLIGLMNLVLDSPLRPEQKEQIETAQVCAQSMLALLNDLLDLSKIEAGRMELEEIPFDIRQLLADCARTHAARAREKGVRLCCDVAMGLPLELLGDPLRIRQILHNLLSNAVKFTERGEIRASVDMLPMLKIGYKPLTLRMVVSDSGIGIPAEHQQAIFTQYEQGGASVARRYGGTGLGLAITRRLVELHGGEIRLESEPGRGTRFTIDLPCRPAPERIDSVGESVAAQETALQECDPRPVLLVEDNAINQKIVTTLLGKRGIPVDVAACGEQALSLLDRRSYGLVLMDVQMPGMDGLETTRRLRADARFQRLPVIAMTAYAMRGDRERCLAAGMTDYLTKPVSLADLIEVLARYLR